MPSRKRPSATSFLSTSSKARETQQSLKDAQEKIAELESQLNESRKRISDLVGAEKISQAVVPISTIQRRLYTSRRERDQEFFDSLVNSIKNYGFRGSIWVQKLPKDELRLIAGETRLDAAIAAGLNEIPVDVADIDDITAVKLSRVENSRRRRLNALDETEELLHLLSLILELNREKTIKLLYRYKNSLEGSSKIDPKLKEVIDSTFAEAAPELSVKTFVSSRLPLLDLPDDVIQAYEKNQIEYTKAILIARVTDTTQRRKILEQTIQEGLSLSALKILIKNTVNKSKGYKTEIRKIEKQYSSILKINVKKLNKSDKNELKQTLLNLQSIVEEKLSEL